MPEFHPLRILCYGSLNIDQVFTMPHIVRPGETMASSRRQVSAGGKGANQAVAAAKAGAQVHMAGKIGSDGRWLKLKLADNHVGTDCVSEKGSVKATGQAVIQVAENTGENAIMLFDGANHEITTVEIRNVLEQFGPTDVLLLQNEINHIPALVTLGHQRGMTVVFNPAPMNSLVVDTVPLDQVDILIVNETESQALLSALSSRSNANRQQHDRVEGLDAKSFICRVRQAYPNLSGIVLTCGAKGTVVDFCPACKFQIRYHAEIPAASPPTGLKIVDTTGAGDTWIGYFVAYLFSRARFATCSEPKQLDALKVAGQVASVAAVMAITQPGAMDSIPDWAAVASEVGIATEDP
ncbi:hypothetical protein H4R34_001631 [Dimargaris verticillata]|uniref:Ribokinase n=1 Tax=Dimargaris verticillata TaxID=2761393 RepID=A0A9W8EDL5_9FUNG|nr:hypothetical protein H4R34_001631 [Dimargaris verticillata]